MEPDTYSGALEDFIKVESKVSHNGPTSPFLISSFGRAHLRKTLHFGLQGPWDLRAAGFRGLGQRGTNGYGRKKWRYGQTAATGLIIRREWRIYAVPGPRVARGCATDGTQSGTHGFDHWAGAQ